MFFIPSCRSLTRSVWEQHLQGPVRGTYSVAPGRQLEGTTSVPYSNPVCAPAAAMRASISSVKNDFSVH